MRMHRSVAGCVVVVWLVALLSERSEGHITFFSPKEMMLMKELEGRKETESQLDEPQPGKQFTRVERGGNPLDHMAPVLEKIIHEIVDEHQKAKQ